MPYTPKHHLTDVARRYPHVWQNIDDIRGQRGRRFEDWPEDCFIPLAACHGAIQPYVGGAPVHLLPMQVKADIAILGALAPWRVTQRIYRFDADLYTALQATPFSKELPAEVLSRLPEWCPYIETPQLVDHEGTRYLGAFVHIEHVHGEDPRFRIVYDTGFDLVPMDFRLSAQPLEDAIRESLHDRIASVKKAGTTVDEMVGALYQMAAHVLSLTLYLCSEEPDLGGGIPTNPSPKNTKKGPRLFPPNDVSYWDVGVRIGAAFRRARAQDSGEPGEETGRRMRPHMRNAHWHTFLKGPRDSERQRVVKWLPPIAVNVENVEALPVTVRPVKDQ